MKSAFLQPRISLGLFVLTTVFVAGAPLAAFILLTGTSMDMPVRLLLLSLGALLAATLSAGLTFQTLTFVRLLTAATSQWETGRLDFRIVPAPFWSNEFLKLSDKVNQMAERLNGLYRRERIISTTLQQMLVTPMPSSRGPLQLADYYCAGSASADIGGDFYALLTLRDGRIGLVFGDIGGRGLDAAVKIAGLRYAIEGFARNGMSPAEVVNFANQIVVENSPEEFVTLIYLVIDPTTGEVEWINAGHEPPLLYRRGTHAWSPLMSNQTALGVVTHANYSAATFRLSPQDQLLLYTDGVASVGPRRDQWSTDDLLQQASAASPNPVGMVKRLSERLPAGDDDIAIVVVQFDETFHSTERQNTDERAVRN